MNPEVVKLLVKIGIVVAIFAAGAGVGWKINGWRLGTELEHALGERDQARDQVKVLAATLNEQTAAINKLGAVTAASQGELRDLVGRIDAANQRAAVKLASLEASLKAATPKRADGTLQDCRDAITAWRDELKGGKQ